MLIYGRTPCTFSEDALYKISLKNSDGGGGHIKTMHLASYYYRIVSGIIFRLRKSEIKRMCAHFYSYMNITIFI